MLKGGVPVVIPPETLAKMGTGVQFGVGFEGGFSA